MDAVGLGINIVQGRPTFLVKKTDRFSCEERRDTERGEFVWTVMYDDGKKKQPWLGMVIPMGGGWSPERRCQEIERRLENYRQDGLVFLGYRDDPNTPQQQVLCVKTKLTAYGCPLLMTLDVGTDGYEALRDTTKALRNGKSFYQSANSGYSGESRFVYLETFLAEEDKLAGE
ncbi:MAG: hypothetical protein F6K01_29940 [Okeania sp. SIO1I7]|nr:hypothetical protein [Okeania sp. SIO1I7]